MEQWDIYDSERRLTGRTMKKNDWILQDGEYHLTVLGVVRNTDGRFLITRRVLTKAWAAGWWEVPGGAVQAGESSREAVNREVWEETHIKVKNIRYFASQPWPYPCGLMVGFIAEYDSGEIQLQRSELNKGGWYSRDNMPAIPGEVSLARHLIDHWLAQ